MRGGEPPSTRERVCIVCRDYVAVVFVGGLSQIMLLEAFCMSFLFW